MDPRIWGKSAWVFLHSVAHSYPEKPNYQDVENYRAFYQQLENVLPCFKCRKNFGKNIKNLPLTNQVLSSQKNLRNWMIKLNNLVNQETNSPLVTLEDVDEMLMQEIKFRKHAVELEKIAKELKKNQNSLIKKTQQKNNSQTSCLITYVIILLILIVVIKKIRI